MKYFFKISDKNYSKQIIKILIIIAVCCGLIYYAFKFTQLAEPEIIHTTHNRKEVIQKPRIENKDKKLDSLDKKVIKKVKVNLKAREMDSQYIPQKPPRNFEPSEFLHLQNEDGSFGETEKTFCTSLVLLSFLSFGQTSNSKDHGKEIMKMALFLADKPFHDESLKEQVMVLRTLSNFYSMTDNKYFLYSYKKRLNHVLEEIKDVNQINAADEYYLSTILRHSETFIPDDMWNKEKLNEVTSIDWQSPTERVHLSLPQIYNSADKEIIHLSLDHIEESKIYRYLYESKR